MRTNNLPIFLYLFMAALVPELQSSPRYFLLSAAAATLAVRSSRLSVTMSCVRLWLEVKVHGQGHWILSFSRWLHSRKSRGRRSLSILRSKHFNLTIYSIRPNRSSVHYP